MNDMNDGQAWGLNLWFRDRLIGEHSTIRVNRAACGKQPDTEYNVVLNNVYSYSSCYDIQTDKWTKIGDLSTIIIS